MSKTHELRCIFEEFRTIFVGLTKFREECFDCLYTSPYDKNTSWNLLFHHSKNWKKYITHSRFIEWNQMPSNKTTKRTNLCLERSLVEPFFCVNFIFCVIGGMNSDTISKLNMFWIRNSTLSMEFPVVLVYLIADARRRCSILIWNSCLEPKSNGSSILAAKQCQMPWSCVHVSQHPGVFILNQSAPILKYPSTQRVNSLSTLLYVSWV